MVENIEKSLLELDFAALTPEQVAGTTYSTQPIPGNVNGPNNLTAGDVFAARTRRGLGWSDLSRAHEARGDPLLPAAHVGIEADRRDSVEL